MLLTAVSPRLIIGTVGAIAIAAFFTAQGYRMGKASANREAVARAEAERDTWKSIAEQTTEREREWLRASTEVTLRWQGSLRDLEALQRERPKTIREVVREGSPCPDISIDPDTFRLLDAATININTAIASP